MSTPEPLPELPATWRSPWKWVIGAALLVHLLAVVITPLHYASRSGANTSPLLDAIETPLRPYTQAAFLNHGYAFFSPDPGSSRLIRYRLTTVDGKKVEQRFPDLKHHWPRLLYHRYFMLSEQAPPYVPATPEPAPRKGTPGYAAAMSDWNLYEAERKRSRQVYELRWEAMKQHLRAAYNVKEVELTRIEHMLPTPGDVLSGMRLHDKRLYRDLPEEAGFAPLGPAAPGAPPGAGLPGAGFPPGNVPPGVPPGNLPPGMPTGAPYGMRRPVDGARVPPAVLPPLPPQRSKP